MPACPAPIVVVTGHDLDHDTSMVTQVTKLGAVSVLQRPESVTSPTYRTFVADLIRQVKLMSSVRVVRRASANRPATVSALSAGATAPGKLSTKTDIVAIGSSTGGPAALHRLLTALHRDFPLPITIVQHISFGFVAGLADWLNDACQVRVKVGQNAERLQAGTVYIAPDEHHLVIDRFGKINLVKSDPINGFRPSVTALFQSVARNYGAAAIGVLLTGMGSDGAVGLLAMRQAGAITLAQDETSCVVFGMPKEAIALGAVQHVVPLDKLAVMIESLIVTA
jgi:two-component system chemotaxis response regulator CheB